MHTYIAEYTNDNGSHHLASTIYVCGSFFEDAQTRADTVKKLDIVVLGKLGNK